MKDDAIAQFDTLNPHDYFYLTRFDYRTEFHEEKCDSKLTLELRKERSPDSPRLVVDFRGVRDLQFSGDVSLSIVIESTEERQWENAPYYVTDDERIGISLCCQSFEARIEA